MKKFAKTKNARIISNNVVLQAHEYRAALFLVEQGYDIEFIPPSSVPGRHKPDFKINGVPWELKSPLIGRHRTLERAFITALKQSCNVVFDLRRIKHPSNRESQILHKFFLRQKNAKKLMIITKRQRILLFDK